LNSSKEKIELLEKGRDLFKRGGLNSALCNERLKTEGTNEFALQTNRTVFKIILELLKEPMVYLLLGCCLVYFILGDAQEAFMLSGFLVLILGLTVTQEAKAEHALEALQKLASPRAQVLRDGKKIRIGGSDVVREDLLFLNEGDRISADGLLVSSSHFFVDESLITGESLPVQKNYAEKVFAGTTVNSGQAVAFVTATGFKTEIGEIGKSLKGESNQSTRLEEQTRSLVGKLSLATIILSLIVIVIYALTRKDWIQGVLTGLTFTMAVLPNELPAVLTIFFSLGAWRLSQKKILTRKISAVENLGSTTVLCVDKTGTLTKNQMEIQMIYSNGLYADTTTATALEEEFHEALEFGILASKRDPFDPMEIAFVKAGEKFLKNTEHLHFDWDLQKEYPLSNELLSISHAWRPNNNSESSTVVGAKGAPEAILDLCHLNQDEEIHLKKIAEDMAAKGLRVLGVAKAKTTETPLPGHQHDFHFQFSGFIGIADPIREGVPEAIKLCHEAGIKILMLTGDHKATALSIAHKIGLQKHDQVMTGPEMETLTDKELEQFLISGRVFSRVMPAQKLRMVKLLKSSGEIAAMTGDGVNDAPALKEAHIGIAMGERGTDVAREASHIVLLKDDFASIVSAIKQGRCIYRNIKNALVYLLAVHIPIAGISLIPVFARMPLVFLPAHIAFLHLIIEPASSVAFEVEPADELLMKKKPRSPNEPLFDKGLLFGSFTRGFFLLLALCGIYFIALERNQGEKEARALVFTTLILANMLLIHFSRDTEQKFRKRLLKAPNKIVIFIGIGSVLLLIMALYLPFIRDLMGFSYLHPNDLLLCFAVAVLTTIIGEIFLDFF